MGINCIAMNNAYSRNDAIYLKWISVIVMRLMVLPCLLYSSIVQEIKDKDDEAMARMDSIRDFNSMLSHCSKWMKEECEKAFFLLLLLGTWNMYLWIIWSIVGFICLWRHYPTTSSISDKLSRQNIIFHCNGLNSHYMLQETSETKIQSWFHC